MAMRPAQWVLVFLLLVLPLQAFGRWRDPKSRKAAL
jgi:hypothetical protein